MRDVRLAELQTADPAWRVAAEDAYNIGRAPGDHARIVRWRILRVAFMRDS